MRFSILSFLLSMLFVTSSVMAQLGTPAHVIKVRADGEVKAIPDRVVIVLGVQSRDSLMNNAKAQNDDMTLKMIRIAKKYGVRDSNISTEYYVVEPKYEDHIKTKFIGYWVSRRIVVNLNDFKRFESLRNEFLDQGLENIQSIRFEISDPDKYTDQALVAALKKATARANLIATQMGVKVGKIYSVDDASSYIRSPNIGGGYPGDDYMHYRGLPSMAVSTGESTTFGYLEATANVSVSFEIE